MSDALRASFTLKLHDELSAGLQKIIAMTKQFRDLAKSLGFGKLDSADATLQRVGRDIGTINTGLSATARQAEAAASAIKRMSSAELDRARAQATQMRQMGAIGRQAAGGATLGEIYGPGGVPLMAGGPRFVPSAPGASSSIGMTGRLGNALGNARNGIGAFSNQVGLVGGAMAGISLEAPIREAAEFDNVLTHIAITAGATADRVRGKVAEMSKTYREMALATKQSSHDVAESAQFLITTGIGEKATNNLLPLIAKASTAYNTQMRDSVQGAFSMHETLHIPMEEMKGALSATALAAKQGHFSFSDVSSLVPEVAALAPVALRGREGLNSILASLEVSRRGAGTSGEAATNFKQFLSDISGGMHSRHSFAKSGIDLPKLLMNAEKEGLNPIEAVMEAVRRHTARMTPAQSDQYLGGLFLNQQSKIFARTFLDQMNYYKQVKSLVGGANEDTIEEDFRKAQNLHTRLVELGEKSHQLAQRVGEGFSWVVPVGSALLGGVLVGLSGMDHVLPGLADGVLAMTGGMLALVAVMGVLGTVAGPVKAGFLLLRPVVLALATAVRGLWGLFLANPLTVVPAIFAIAAVHIWQHWSRFRDNFEALWVGIKQIASGDIWAGLKQVSEQTWGVNGIMHKLMRDFVDWLPSWGQSVAVGLGTAMQAGYAAIADSLKGWDELLHSLTIPAPPGQEQQRLDTGRDPGGRDDLGLPGTEGIPLGKPLPARRSAYRPGAGAGADDGPRRIHVTFEADVPGRASIRTDDASVRRPAMRGPTLSRA